MSWAELCVAKSRPSGAAPKSATPSQGGAPKPATPSQGGAGLVRASACGCWSISILGIWLTVTGRDIKSPSSEVFILTMISLVLMFGPFVVVFFSPLSLGGLSSTLGNVLPDTSAIEKRLH